MSIHDNLNSPLLKRVKTNETAIEELQEGTGSPTRTAEGEEILVTNSAASPLIDLKLTGKSVQNGTPTPDAPQSIENVGDCVDIIQGFYNTSTGAYMSGSTAICNKNPISCTSGDVIAIETETLYTIRLFFYNDTGFLSVTTMGGTSVNGTVPSGATYFNIAISTSTEITPSTVGKISLTINGKYVVQIVENGKNLLDCSGLVANTTDGITFTPSYDSDGQLEYVNVNGTATETVHYTVATDFPLVSGVEYTLNGCPSGGNTNTYILFANVKSGIALGIDNGSGVNFSITDETKTHEAKIRISKGVTVSNLKFYPMIRKADITDGTYEPYKEKVATVLLNEPLRESDVMSRTEVVRKRFSKVFDGSEDWSTSACITSSGAYRLYCRLSSQPMAATENSKVGNVLCDNYAPTTANDTYNLTQGISAIKSGGGFYIYDENYNTSDVTLWASHLASNPITIEYELAEPIVETLDTSSQEALNTIETFNPITHITVGSRIKPEISVEYVHKAYESIVNSLIDRIEAIPEPTPAEEWKLVGEVTGRDKLTLPEDWKELNIFVFSSPFCGNLSIPRIIFDRISMVAYYTIPFKELSGRDARISLTAEETGLFAVYVNGESQADDSGLVTNFHLLAYYK